MNTEDMSGRNFENFLLHAILRYMPVYMTPNLGASVQLLSAVDQPGLGMVVTIDGHLYVVRIEELQCAPQTQHDA